jgi:hypothetical protein
LAVASQVACSNCTDLSEQARSGTFGASYARLAALADEPARPCPQVLVCLCPTGALNGADQRMPWLPQLQVLAQRSHAQALFIERGLTRRDPDSDQIDADGCNAKA